MPTHISLPNERVEQLRMIAKAKNTTIPEVIAGFVRAEIEKGTIPATIPGIDVSADGPTITIRANGFEASVPMNEGPTLADLLKGSATSTADPDRKRRWIEGLAALSGVKVKRAGNGVKLVSPITGKEFPLNLDVAADLAGQIDRAAK
mgnify:CR=1 FL=1